MGGSGNSRYIPSSGRSQWDIVEPSVDKTDEKFIATETSNFLQEKLKQINAHNYDAIDQHKRIIEDKLKSEFEVEDIRFGGSHSTHTDVKGLSDIDILADLGDFGSSESSNQVIKDFANAIQERLPATKVSSGVMAVTVEFSDGLKVQVLPAFRHQDGYRISDPSGKGWILTYPKRFARELTSVNKEQSGQVVPTIKLIKSICDANNIEISSYHASNLALKAFKGYTGPKTCQKMLQHFFNKAKTSCTEPTSDPSGQTKYVDGDLSKGDRTRMAKAFAQMEEKVNEAMEPTSLDRCKDIFKK